MHIEFSTIQKHPDRKDFVSVHVFGRTVGRIVNDDGWMSDPQLAEHCGAGEASKPRLYCPLAGFQEVHQAAAFASLRACKAAHVFRHKFRCYCAVSLAGRLVRYGTG